MRKMIGLIALCVLLTGCASTGGTVPNIQSPTCEEIVSYIATVDAIAETFPKDVYTDEVKAAKAWYKVARTGAIAGLSKKCPDMIKSLGQPVV